MKGKRGRFAWACLLISIALLLSPLIAVQVPLFDLASLIRLPATLALLISATWLAYKASSWAFRIVLLAAVTPAIAATFTRTELDSTLCDQPAITLRIAWINARHPQDAGQIMSWLDNEKPQIVGIAELGKTSTALREALANKFPDWASCLHNERCSTLLYTQQKPLSVAPLASGNPENRKALSAVKLRLRVGAKKDFADIFAVHLSRPLPLGKQARELAQLEGYLEDAPRSIVMGDFNMSPRMRLLRDFSARNGLTITRTDRPTWPAHLGGWSMPGIWQIDHLLVGNNWAVTAIRVSPDLGSDHRGYVADLCSVS